MRPSQPLRLVARDRARRHPAGRPDFTSIRVTAWPDAGLASADAGPVPADEGAPPKRNRATRAFLIALIAAVAVNFGAVSGSVGWSVLQALGWVAAPAIEAMQREQAASLSQLDATVQALNAAVVGLNARADSAGEREGATGRWLAEIDDALGTLRTSTNEIRAAQNAAEDSWRKPVAELATTVARARGDVVGLRASLDELSRQRQPELVAIGTRIDRIERAMIDRNLLGPIRGSIQETARPRSIAARESSSADGHIIQLTPAQ